MKVVWLCTFSDSKLRQNLSFPKWHWANILRRFLNMPNNVDFAIWDTYAIHEFEKMNNDIELHVVAPHSGISRLHEFESKGIHYHIFWNEWDVVIEKIKRKFNLRNEKSFKLNRKTIINIIEKLNPDIVHVIGVENKFHSMAVLDLSKNIPVITQLQTLVNDIRFKNGTRASASAYCFDCKIEKLILERADYIGATTQHFANLIYKDIKRDAKIINTALPLTEPLDKAKYDKDYDFVYFAADISKAFDLALEAFAIVYNTDSSVTLDVVGGYSEDYKSKIDQRIVELKLSDAIRFEGKLPLHEDVIRQIKRSKFALLPLKIDVVSGTIREAMANGLPVVTTITPGTPELNKQNECVLLSEMGDHQAMASNMLKLLKEPNLAETIRENAWKKASERIENGEVVKRWCDAYSICIDNFKNGTPLPESLIVKPQEKDDN